MGCLLTPEIGTPSKLKEVLNVDCFVSKFYLAEAPNTFYLLPKVD